MWILAYVVTRSAFAAWAAALRATFGTGRIPELRGWALRAPVLGVAFGVIVVAGIGLPGFAAFDARADPRRPGARCAAPGARVPGTFAPLALLRPAAVRRARPTGPDRRRGSVRGSCRGERRCDLNDVRGSVGTFWGAESGGDVDRGREPHGAPRAGRGGRRPRWAGGRGRPAAGSRGARPNRSCRSPVRRPGHRSRSRASHPGEGPGGPSFQPVPTE